jgi:hypothetical protein
MALVGTLEYISGKFRGCSRLEELVVEGKKILKYVLHIQDERTGHMFSES